jgi:predicted ATPase/DNA-binding winged helix-turn-helix (wHTH) protein
MEEHASKHFPISAASGIKNAFMFGPFKLSVAERLLKRGDEVLTIGGRSFDLLIVLVERAGDVISHKELIARAWPDVTVEKANLRVHISALRKVLGDGLNGARYISNVASRGYCFVAAVARSGVQQALPAPDSPLVNSRTHNLPARLMRMVGRDQAVRQLQDKLMTCRFVSIVGPGGVGKTTVAVAVAHALVEGFHGAVSFVDLGVLADSRLVPTAVASALGIATQAQDPLLSLLGFLGDRKILLVLDNCEHVIDAAAELAERVISEAPQAHIFATSREALRAEGEHVHILNSFDSPPNNPRLQAAEALRYPAVQLFMERALASGYHSELSDTDAPVVANICRRLDGIALAIELAATRTGSLGIRGTAEMLDNRSKIVWNGRRMALPRHQTLNSMLDWSYNLLSDLEKRVLCRLSILVGDFTIKAACEVAAEAEIDDARITQVVTSLLAKSLISTTHSHRSTYYRLLDTTRAYALAKLADRGEMDCMARRHATTFCKYLKDQNLQSGSGEEELAEYAPHIGNVRAALDWALSDSGDRVIGVELATCAVPLLIRLSFLDECRRYCEQALGMIDERSCDTRAEMILQEALALSSMFLNGNSDEALAAINRGLTLAEKLNDTKHQLELLAGQNIFFYRAGDFYSALAVAERASAVADAAKNAAGLAITEWMLGVSHHFLGDQAAALQYCESGMIRAVEFGALNPGFFGDEHRVLALTVLARSLWLRGHPNQALRKAQEAIDEAAARSQAVSVCMSLYGAQVFLWTGDLDRSSHLIDWLIEYAGRHSLSPYRAVGIALKGELAVARGEVEIGIKLLREALKTLHSKRYNLFLCEFACALTAGLRKAGHFEEALLTINGAIGRANSSGAIYDMPELLRLKGEVLAEVQHANRTAALECVEESLKLAREQSALAYELRSATTLARLLFESGRQGEARNILEPVHGRFREGFETTDLRDAQALLASLAR